MGQQIYFDNYSAVGDISVLAICMVMTILIATSYVVRTKPFRMFICMIIYLAAAALSDLVMHDWYLRITDGRYTGIYVARIIFHCFLFSLLLLFVVYIVVILGLEKRVSRPIMIISTVIYFTVLIIDIVTTIRGTGFRLNSDGDAASKINVFIFGYAAFLLVALYLLFRHGGRIYIKSRIGLVGSMAVSLLILHNQGVHGQTSFTVVTFLFPILAFMYLLHSNPYNIELGAIGISAFKDTISYNYTKKRDFVFISLYIPEYDFEGKTLPEEMQQAIRRFSTEYFKRSVLFRVSNGHMVLLADVKANPDLKQKITVITDAFMSEYEKYKLDYKLVFGQSVEGISEKNAYLSFIRIIHRDMPLNTIHMVSDEDVAKFDRAVDILKELEDIQEKQDLDDERVLVYCQPVFNLRTRTFDTAEALMRMKLPGLGMVFPDQFISLAEEHGYIHTLTRIILYKTCKAIGEMLAEGYKVKRISVNVSVPEFRDDSFTAEIQNIIAATDIPNEKIAIEITESQSDSDYKNIQDAMEELKGKGIKFYLDDFGTGYSNMDRIMKLPFDIIKFDRSLVIASETDVRSREVVRSLASIFAGLDYAVLYEGIENDADEIRCTQMSASYLQGYKYSKPIPIGELRNLFSKAV